MLTTKEFIKEVKKLGFGVNDKNISGIWIENSNGEHVAYACRYKMCKFDTCFIAFDNISEFNKVSLFNLLDEYARTPIGEREEPQKYYLMNKWLKNIDNHKCFLNRFLDSYYFLGNITENSSFKTQFTQAEIDEIKEKFNVSLKDFEKIPVEEVEDEE